MERRTFLQAGGCALAGLALPLRAATIPEIRLLGARGSGLVAFDPVGLYIEPGTTVRWVNAATRVHTVTAYHPANGNHPLRIPFDAQPWNSGYLVEAGETFSWHFTVPGVYDYFCIPHEIAGMAGRLVVGTATGPGSWPCDYFVGDPDYPSWRPVPEAVQARLPEPASIIEHRRIPVERTIS